MNKKLFIALLLLALVACEECEFQNKCPAKQKSTPVCGKEPPQQVAGNLWSQMLCAAESPWTLGGKFTYSLAFAGKITQIVTLENRDNYCTEPSGTGSNVFSTKCACKHGCLILGQWQVFFEM